MSGEDHRLAAVGIADDEFVVYMDAATASPFHLEGLRQIFRERRWPERNGAASGQLNHQGVRLGLARHIGDAHHQQFLRIERIERLVGRTGLLACAYPPRINVAGGDLLAKIVYRDATLFNSA